MRRPTPMLGSRLLRALGPVVLVAVTGVALAADEPTQERRLPRRPVLPRGPFFGVPAIPGPIPSPLPFSTQPIPIPPSWSVAAPAGPTDRCLVIPSPIDERSLKVAETIDPGMIKEPKVQGLPIERQGRWRR